MNKLAVAYDIYNKDGHLVRIEVVDSNGDHVFDALWDENDEQTSENRIAFRGWTRQMAKRKGYELPE